MKNVLFTLALVSVMAISGSVFAGTTAQADENLPQTIGVTVQMPDGSVHTLDFTKALQRDRDGLQKVVYIPPPIILPPIQVWQLGWFYFQSVPFFGFRGPNGIQWMSTYFGGVWHCFRFENVNNTWIYMGIL